jgi:hypothetical protein
MQPGPVRTVRQDGLLSAVAEPLSYAPGVTGLIAGAADAYGKGGATGLLSNAADIALGAVGGKAAPMLRKIAAGENARKIPRDVRRSLEMAQEFGVPGQKFDDKVWMGLEGRPRWEISDRKAAIVKGVESFPEGATLDRVLKHDDLFAQYPELKGYRVYPLSKSPNYKGEANKALGAHDEKNKIIYLKEGMPPKEQLSVLLHELQHGVQAAEGHASGASNTAATHLAINMVENWKNAAPEKKRLLRAQMKSEFEFDPEKDSVLKLADRMYQKKYGEVEARTTQKRHEQTLTKERTEIMADDGDFLDTMGKDRFSPVMWQDVWKQMFGHRELPPFVNLETGKTIPIRDF